MTGASPQRRSAALISIVLIVLGEAIVARTAAAGAGFAPAVGYVYGGLMMVVGCLRLWLASRIGGN